MWCGGDKDPNPSVPGCGFTYYNCQEDDVKKHQVKYCDSYIVWWPPGLSLPKRVGICSAPFRDCPYSTSRKGVHSYYPVESTANGKRYISGYSAKDTGFPDYGKSYHNGSTTPPSAKDGKPLVHGANGVGVDAVIPDATPNCNTCIADSHNCPNCGSSSNDNQADDEESPPSPAVFKPSLALTYNSSTGAVSMTATANKPIYGADLYVRSPGDGSKYGTKIRWTSGNSNRTTFSLPVRYAFPSTVASGTYKFTLRVYPFNNSGSGDPWGTPYDVFDNVTVQ